MGRILDPQNRFFRALGTLVDLMGLSLLWLVCSLPVVTLGAASAALYHAVLRCVLPRENGAFTDFFRALRENLLPGLRATLAVLAAAVPAYLLMRLFALWYGQGYAGGLLLETALGVALLLPAGMTCLLFPLTARFTFSLRALLRTALGLTLRHFFRALLLTGLAALSVWLCLLFWAPVLILPALWSLCAARVLEPIFSACAPES